MSAEGFSRTLQTATDADGIAALLERSANKVGGGLWGDAGRLLALSERYRDYAAALRETVASADPEPDDGQAVLL